MLPAGFSGPDAAPVQGLCYWRLHPSAVHEAVTYRQYVLARAAGSPDRIMSGYGIASRVPIDYGRLTGAASSLAGMAARRTIKEKPGSGEQQVSRRADFQPAGFSWDASSAMTVSSVRWLVCTGVSYSLSLMLRRGGQRDVCPPLASELCRNSIYCALPTQFCLQPGEFPGGSACASRRKLGMCSHSILAADVVIDVSGLKRVGAVVQARTCKVARQMRAGISSGG